MHGNPDLPEVGHAGNPSRFFLRGRQRRQQQACENRDNRNYNQQLNERESAVGWG